MINFFKRTNLCSIYVPWKLDGYINGNHPLINSYLLFISKKFNIVYPNNNIKLDACNASIKNKMIEFNSFRCINQGDIYNFIEYASSRNNLSDLYQPDESIALHHSIMPSTSFPSIMHYETPLTFFIPHLSHGNFLPGFSLKNHFLYRHIYESLCNPNIRMIFTHSYLGYLNFKNLFPDSSLHKKLHHIPADSFVLDFIYKYRRNSFFHKKTTKNINLLFTSSYFSDEKTFWLRGGAITLKVFDYLNDQLNIKLNFVGKIPKNLPREFQSILSNPNLTTHEFLSDYDLQRLYDDSHILISPTVGLHAMSLLRAVNSGLFVISSNAPGVTDFIKPGISGQILECPSLNNIYFQDRSSSILLDDYRSIKEFNYASVPIFTEALYELVSKFDKNFTNQIISHDSSIKKIFKEKLSEAIR